MKGQNSLRSDSCPSIHNADSCILRCTMDSCKGSQTHPVSSGAGFSTGVELGGRVSAGDALPGRTPGSLGEQDVAEWDRLPYEVPGMIILLY